MEEYTHRVYVKHPTHTSNRFMPISDDGGFTNRLIYAVMFTEDNAKNTASRLQKLNPEFEFCVRKI